MLCYKHNETRRGRYTDGDDSIHNLGLVGHIEDIAVAKDQQGKKLGLRIIQALDYVAEKVGCYKVRYFRLHSRDRQGLTISRAYSIAPRQMKVSTSSVGSRERDWRWRIITRRQRQSTRRRESDVMTRCRKHGTWYAWAGTDDAWSCIHGHRYNHLENGFGSSQQPAS